MYRRLTGVTPPQKKLFDMKTPFTGLLVLLTLSLNVQAQRRVSAPMRHFMQQAASPANAIPYGNNPNAGHYVTAGDARIYYEVYGKGKPLVVLHGGGVGSTYEMFQFIDSLSKTYQVIAVSTRGHGKSEIGQLPLTYEQKADDVLAVINAVTKDSVLVMMHDQTLDRTTNGTGKLIDKTYADIQQYRLEDNAGNLTAFKIPTLEQVLRWGKNKVTFTLDVKRNVSFDKVVDMIHKTGAAGYACVITYNAQDAAKVHKLDPSLMISVTIRNRAEYDRHHDLGIPDNRMVAFVGVKEPDAELYQFLHQKGIPCILGTLGNLDKQAVAKGDQVYRQFVKNGADIMSTDRPVEVWQSLSKQ